jgi:apolipoprotein N-acyltransferase
MKKFHKLLLSALSGLILSLGWYEWGSGLFLFIGLVPLLFVEEYVSQEQSKGKKSSSVFLYASFAFLIWNIIDTWWIKNASFAGLLAAMIVTTFLMSVPFWLYSVSKRIWGRRLGYISLIIYWLAYEFTYLHGEISWPWLTLGHGFAFDTKLIQWYEVTGVFGGSLWVLVVNILLFEFIRKSLSKELQTKRSWLLIIAFAIIIIPISISLIRYYTYKEDVAPQEIVVVQPNIDPYLKFNDISSIEQTQIQISEAGKAITPNTDYVACPETSVMDNIWIGKFNEVPDIQMIQNFVKAHSRLKYITGIMCYKEYQPSERTATSKEYGNSGIYYDSFNSGIQIDSTENIPIYHKSQLVTGVEKMPYPQYLKVLEKLTLHLGGTFRSHGTQKERAVFSSPDNLVKVAPVICWESVFGEFVGDYIKKGANIIFVITNDGWWGNTPGHRQHNSISCIRAIETRRSIARSANTGISCFINQRGDVLQSLTWWKRGALRGTLNINNKVTFYSKHGDFIARSAFYLAGLLLLFLLPSIFITKKNKHNK